MFELMLVFLGVENRISNGNGKPYEVIKFKRETDGKNHVIDFFLTSELKAQLGTAKPGEEVKLKFELTANKGWARVELLGLAS